MTNTNQNMSGTSSGKVYISGFGYEKNIPEDPAACRKREKIERERHPSTAIRWGRRELVREATKSLLWTSTDVTALCLVWVQPHLSVTSASAKVNKRECKIA